MGALAASHYESSTFQLETDDLLVAYTDGVTEAEDSQGAAFGQTRLERSLCDSYAEDPQEVLQQIVDELSAHSAGCSQADDITLVVMRVAAK